MAQTLYKDGVAVTDEAKIREQVSELQDSGSFAKGYSLEAPVQETTPVVEETPVVEAPKATTDTPVIERGSVPTETTTPTITRDTYISIMSKDPKTLTEEDKTTLRTIQARQGLGESLPSIFGETTGTDTTATSNVGKTDLGYVEATGRRAIERQTQKALVDAQNLYTENLSRATNAIQESGRRTMNTAQRLFSLRGTGRSSENEAQIMSLQENVNSLISAAQQTADLELQQRKMQIEGASAEAMTALQTSIQEAQKTLSAELATAQKTQLDINNSLAVDNKTSMDAMMNVLKLAGENTAEIDTEKSAKLGYFVKNDGSVYYNNAGNPVEFKTTISANYSPEQIDSFAQGIAGGQLKFSDLDLDNTDIALVMQAMNGKLDSKPGLSVNVIKAQRILKDIGLTPDEQTTNTVSNLLKVYTEEEVRDMIATDNFKQANFVAGNQKLFDDLRKDATSFKDIERTYKGMNDIWEDFKNNPSNSRAAMEQALIIMFNKMLDPGSVVREGEFDRTSQGQSVLNAAEGWLQKLQKGGAGIKNEAFEDIINIANTLYQASQDTALDLKSSYKNYATDLGADPDFVDRFFERGFDLGIEFDANASIDDIYGNLTGSGASETQKFDFNKDEDIGNFLDFSSGDQTSSLKGLEDILKSEEGFRTQAYLDVAGIPTIGYGFTSVNGKPVKMGQTITQEEAEKELQRQIDRHSNFKNVVKVQLTPQQQQALASFEYNLGPGIWKTTGKDIIDAINKGNLQEAARIMKLHNKARDPNTKQLVEVRGLTNRRNREANLLLNS